MLLNRPRAEVSQVRVLTVPVVDFGLGSLMSLSHVSAKAKTGLVFPATLVHFHRS